MFIIDHVESTDLQKGEYKCHPYSYHSDVITTNLLSQLFSLLFPIFYILSISFFYLMYSEHSFRFIILLHFQWLYSILLCGNNSLFDRLATVGHLGREMFSPPVKKRQRWVFCDQVCAEIFVRFLWINAWMCSWWFLHVCAFLSFWCVFSSYRWSVGMPLCPFCLKSWLSLRFFLPIWLQRISALF